MGIKGQLGGGVEGWRVLGINGAGAWALYMESRCGRAG